MRYVTARRVVECAMMEYYQTSMKKWRCTTGSRCNVPYNVCHCFSGPLVNLLCWLSILMDREQHDKHRIMCQVMDDAVYLRVGQRDAVTWLFPLCQGDEENLAPTLEPLICRFDRGFNLTWCYAGYYRLDDASGDTRQLNYKIINSLRNPGDMVRLKYFILVSYITLDLRDEQKRQRMLLTALFLASPEACVRFCSTCCRMLGHSPNQYDTPAVLLFISGVLHDLLHSMHTMMRADYVPKDLDGIGYWDELSKWFDSDSNSLWKDDIGNLLMASCQELERCAELEELLTKVESLLPREYVVDGSNLKEARYFFDCIVREGRINAARTGDTKNAP